MADSVNLINLNEVTQSPGEYVTNIDANGKYVVEKTGDGTWGCWGPFPDANSAAATPPYGRLRVDGAKWGCRMLTPGYYFIRVDGTSGTFKLRRWKFSDYIMIKMHGG